MQETASAYKIIVSGKNKEYNKDDYIAGCWDAINYIINNSYMITILVIVRHQVT